MVQCLRILADHLIPLSKNTQPKFVEGEYQSKIDKSIVLVKGSVVSGGVLLTLVMAAFATLGFTGVLPIGMLGNGLLAGGAGVAGVATLLYVGGIAVGVVVRSLPRKSSSNASDDLEL